MLRISNPNEFRGNINSKINTLLNNEKISKNIEKGIYNYSISEAEKRNIVKKWDNIYFIQCKI